MTVYIKVKKRFGITERGWKAGDQSIHYFEPGVYEVDDAFANDPYVMENSERIAAPDDHHAANEAAEPNDEKGQHEPPLL
jgi:hypothetical protein